MLFVNICQHLSYNFFLIITLFILVGFLLALYQVITGH